MTKSNQHLQAVALPYAWENGELHFGLVTNYRSRNWTLPKASVGRKNSGSDVASNEALRQGGLVGLVEEEPLLTVESGKGNVAEFFPMEVTASLDSWELSKHHSRKMVPMTKVEKFVADRGVLRALKTLAEEHLGLELVN